MTVTAEDVVEEVEVVEEEVVEEAENDGGEVEEDPEGDEEKPLWMQEAEEEGGGEVPLSALLKQKGKTKDLRGKLDERDEENEKLQARIVELENTPGTTATVKRPRLNDFESDEDYEDAMDAWEDSRLTNAVTTLTSKKDTEEKIDAANKRVMDAVDGHYARADKLVKDNSIKPEVYKAADTAVRKVIDVVMPKQGDAVADSLIAILGDGSEKTMFYLGRNKTALNEFRSILQDDPTGLSAAVFLGKISNQLSNSKRRNSNAPAPAANVNGDVQGGAKSGALKKKYDAAHKKGNISEAFKLKRQAKAAGHDTKIW